MRLNLFIYLAASSQAIRIREDSSCKLPRIHADSDGVKEDMIESVSSALGTFGKGCIICLNEVERARKS